MRILTIAATSFRDRTATVGCFRVTTRLPGRIDSTTTTFASAGDLASALRRTEAAHGQHGALGGATRTGDGTA